MCIGPVLQSPVVEALFDSNHKPEVEIERLHADSVLRRQDECISSLRYSILSAAAIQMLLRAIQLMSRLSAYQSSFAGDFDQGAQFAYVMNGPKGDPAMLRQQMAYLWRLVSLGLSLDPFSCCFGD